jgi:hypothetical protein
MEITGKIVQVQEEQSGNGRNGVWRKKEYILETAGQYPKKVCISVRGDKIDQFNINTGDQVTAGIEIESREFNGRWYTDVRVWKVNKEGNGAASPPAADNQPDVTTFSDESGDDILPF